MRTTRGRNSWRARWLIGWLGLVPLMIANGMMREAWLAPRMTSLAAHQISTLAACAIYAVYLHLSFGWLDVRTRTRAWVLGAAWLALTVGFEFAFGRYVARHPWERLLADYDLLSGRVWSLFLAWVLVAPRLALAWREAGGREA